MRDGTAVMVHFNGSDSMEALASEYGDRIKFISGTAKAQLGLNSVLVRPDGFVAWASNGEPDESSVRAALRRWFGARTTTRTP
jgi:hypothetical protein